MKIKRSSSILWAIFCCLFSCVICSFAGDKMEREYIVTINGIPMQRSSAEKFFRYLEADGSRDIGARDTKTNAAVRSVTEGMNVTIQSNLMEEISKLYYSFLNKKEHDYNVIMDRKLQVCVASSKQFEEKEIELCINNENRIIVNLLWD